MFDLIGFATLLVMCSGGVLHSPHRHDFFGTLSLLLIRITRHGKRPATIGIVTRAGSDFSGHTKEWLRWWVSYCQVGFYHAKGISGMLCMVKGIGAPASLSEGAPMWADRTLGWSAQGSWAPPTSRRVWIVLLELHRLERRQGAGGPEDA